MQENEFRVRPVTRYVLTHYHLIEGKGSIRNVGEFPNVESAEEVGIALQALVPDSTFVTLEGREPVYPPKALAAAMAVRAEPKEYDYVIVERSFDPAAKAFYAESDEHAELHRIQLEAHYRREFRVFSREVKDPVKLMQRKVQGIGPYLAVAIEPDLPATIPLGTAIIWRGEKWSVAYVKSAPGELLYGLDRGGIHAVEVPASDVTLATTPSS